MKSVITESVLAALLAFGISFTGCSGSGVEQSVEAGSKSALPEMSDAEFAPAFKLIEAVPDSPKGYVLLASAYVKRARRTGDFGLNEKAEASLDKALAIEPANMNARKLKASLFATFHRFSEARVAALALEKEIPNDQFIYGVLTDANAELGNYDEAVQAAQKMVDLKPNSSSYARVAHLRSLYGDHKGAVEMYKLAARTADPADKEAQSWCLVQLGDEFWKNGNYADAEKVYDEALSVFPDFHLALAGKGRAKASRGDLAGAVKELAAVAARVPNVDSIILLGDVLRLLGREDAAKLQYELVQVVEERLGGAGGQKLALFWADRDTRLDEALAVAAREYGLRKDVYTADVYAWCLLKNGRPQDAKKAIEDAMHLKTGDARILYHAGMIQRALGNHAEAARLIGAALKLNPAFDLLQAKIARSALAEIKK